MTAGAIYIAFSYNASIKDFSEYFSLKIKRKNKTSFHKVDQKDAKCSLCLAEH